MWLQKRVVEWLTSAGGSLDLVVDGLWPLNRRSVESVLYWGARWKELWLLLLLYLHGLRKRRRLRGDAAQARRDRRKLAVGNFLLDAWKSRARRGHWARHAAHALELGQSHWQPGHSVWTRKAASLYRDTIRGAFGWCRGGRCAVLRCWRSSCVTARTTDVYRNFLGSGWCRGVLSHRHSQLDLWLWRFLHHSLGFNDFGFEEFLLRVSFNCSTTFTLMVFRNPPSTRSLARRFDCPPRWSSERYPTASSLSLQTLSSPWTRWRPWELVDREFPSPASAGLSGTVDFE